MIMIISFIAHTELARYQNSCTLPDLPRLHLCIGEAMSVQAMMEGLNKVKINDSDEDGK